MVNPPEQKVDGNMRTFFRRLGVWLVSAATFILGDCSATTLLARILTGSGVSRESEYTKWQRDRALR
jgi:hypothetical protein